MHSCNYMYKNINIKPMTHPSRYLSPRCDFQIYGAGFVNRTGLLRCRFGGESVEALYSSPRVVRCSAPAQSVPGAIDVAVSIDGGASFGHAIDPAAGHFRYFAPSFVTSLLPRSGPDTGGTLITAFGTGFSSDFRFACSFRRGTGATVEADTGAAVPAMFVSSSELTCIAPPLASASSTAQAKEVVISVDFGDGLWVPVPTAPGGSSGLITFTFMPAVQLAVLSPTHGPGTGGTVVDIGGANFLPPGSQEVDIETVWCRFGLIATVGSRLSDGLIRCSSPPRGIGAPTEAEVTISVNGGGDFARGPLGSELVRRFAARGD